MSQVRGRAPGTAMPARAVPAGRTRPGIARSATSTSKAEAKQARREALVDAALELVRREGPLVTMEQIATACGVTKPIIYRHFGDRDGLVNELAGRFVADLGGVLEAHLDADGPPLELLAATMDAYLALIEREQSLYRFVTMHAGNSNLDVVAALVTEQIALAMEQILDERHLPTDPARTWAAGLVGMVHFAAQQWIDDGATDRRTVLNRLIQLLWVGFEGLGAGDLPPRPPVEFPLPMADQTQSDEIRSHFPSATERTRP